MPRLMLEVYFHVMSIQVQMIDLEKVVLFALPSPVEVE